MSDFNDYATSNFHHRIYDDAMDVGIAIRSIKTDNVVTYYWAGEIRNGENELQYVEYLPLPEDVKKYPSAAGTKVHIFND
jgi:hypothetical protein